MSEYTAKAEEFLKNANASMSFELIGKKKNPNWGDTVPRNVYNVDITTPLGSMHVTFWDSVYNTRHSIEPTSYDVLSCLQKYDCGTFEDFCYEFGYSDDSIRAYNIYQLCVKEYENVCLIFTEAQIEELREIN